MLTRIIFNGDNYLFVALCRLWKSIVLLMKHLRLHILKLGMTL